MGPRSITNMVFIILLAAVLAFALFMTWNMGEAVFSLPPA